MLTDLESVFRSMKSELGMRPVYHQTTKRTDGHLWITLLAYHIVHHIRMRLKKNDIHNSWDTLRKKMYSHQRITTTMNTRDGRTLHIRKASRPVSHGSCLSTMHLDYPPIREEQVKLSYQTGSENL